MFTDNTPTERPHTVMPTGYAHGVINDDASLTPEQRTAVNALRASAQEVVDAKEKYQTALDHRRDVARAHWRALRTIGPRAIERIIGADVLREGTVRNLTDDLERQLKREET